MQGLSNRQIAVELSRSPNTVTAQLKSAMRMRKYEVTSRTAPAGSVREARTRPCPSMSSSAQPTHRTCPLTDPILCRGTADGRGESSASPRPISFRSVHR
ncbi:LuxR C-terminal-related transcriptional regulator [Streptomyces sp. NPDC055681]